MLFELLKERRHARLGYHCFALLLDFCFTNDLANTKMGNGFF